MTDHERTTDEGLSEFHTAHLDGFLALPTNLQRALVRAGRSVAGMSDHERRVAKASFTQFADLETLPDEVRALARTSASIVTGVLHRTNTQELGMADDLQATQAEQQRRWLELRGRP